jgi:hypothetical protein
MNVKMTSITKAFKTGFVGSVPLRPILEGKMRCKARLAIIPPINWAGSETWQFSKGQSAC